MKKTPNAPVTLPNDDLRASIRAMLRTNKAALLGLILILLLTL